jgi:hypothetical protein
LLLLSLISAGRFIFIYFLCISRLKDFEINSRDERGVFVAALAASPLTPLNQNQYITIMHINNSSVFASACCGPYFYICSETKETLHNDDPCFINEIMIPADAELFTRRAPKGNPLPAHKRICTECIFAA